MFDPAQKKTTDIAGFFIRCSRFPCVLLFRCGGSFLLIMSHLISPRLWRVVMFCPFTCIRCKQGAIGLADLFREGALKLRLKKTPCLALGCKKCRSFRSHRSCVGVQSREAHPQTLYINWEKLLISSQFECSALVGTHLTSSNFFISCEQFLGWCRYSGAMLTNEILHRKTHDQDVCIANRWQMLNSKHVWKQVRLNSRCTYRRDWTTSMHVSVSVKCVKWL